MIVAQLPTNKAHRDKIIICSTLNIHLKAQSKMAFYSENTKTQRKT